MAKNVEQESKMLARYRMFAGYNTWCNERLYEAAAQIADAEYRANRGAYFKSLHGTLNHLLVGDRIWMRRFTAQGEVPPNLDAILFDDFAQLRTARRTEDERISRYIGALSDGDLTKRIRYRTFVNPQDIEQMLAPALDHFFNHQTHHRGQAHALLSGILGNDRTPSFDLIIYQRQTGDGALRTIN
ncbi:MAG TPA: DinB family protein [Pseudolabrys sp.]|nr:DinB family protein [Pseudolabrys sp.]